MNKFLLALSAAGIWANAIAMVVNPARADTAEYLLSHMSSAIDGIERSLVNIKNTLGNVEDECRR